MSPIAIVDTSTRNRGSNTPPMWWYVLVCFGWNTLIVGATALARLRWGISAPALFGSVSALLSILIPATLFLRNCRRRFRLSERRQFTLGCFIAFWFYDEFLRAALMVAHGGVGARQIAIAVVATLIDFAFVWI